MEKEKIVRRDFLNEEKSHGLAAIRLESELIETTMPNKDVHKSHWGSVEISDCSRVILLDFTFGDEEERINALKKCDKIVDYFYEMREIIVNFKLKDE